MVIQSYATLLLFSIIFSNCWDGKNRCLGKIPTPITKGLYFKIYQSNDFEQFTAISGEIVNDKDSSITSSHFLIGTDLHECHTNNFRVKEYDSIIYLTYVDPKEVITIYDLRSGAGYPFFDKGEENLLIANRLLKRLQQFDNEIIGYWNH